MNKAISIFLMMLCLMAISGMAKEITVDTSDGHLSDLKLMYTGPTHGLSEPPYFLDGEETACDFTDFGGEIMYHYCKGSSHEDIKFTICNTKEAYIKANLVDCKTQERIAGPIVIGPDGDCESFTCPKGRICKWIWTEWQPCNLGIKRERSGDVIFPKEECDKKMDRECVNNKLYLFDGCGKPIRYITCMYGCELDMCKPQPEYDKNEPICGDNMCSPMKENAENCEEDCDLMYGVEVKQEANFPLGLLIAVVILVAAGITLGRRKKKK